MTGSSTSPAFQTVLQDSLSSGRFFGDWFTVDPSRVQTSLEGVGESYAVWLVTDGETSLVFRVPHRPLEEMPQSMVKEFESFALVPPQVGPAAVHFEPTGENPLGTPFMVTRYAPGRAITSEPWPDRAFESLSRQIALLHASSPARPNLPQVDILRGFTEARNWWIENRPELALSEKAKSLGSEVHAYIAARNWACEGVRPLFIHGDLCATNIVWDDDWQPQLVDWEWSEFGDPAKDLAYQGGRAWCYPWYVPMSNEQVLTFVTNYVVRFAELRGLPSPSSSEINMVLTRRQAWEAWERYTMGLHCLWRGVTEGTDNYLLYGTRMHERLRTMIHEDAVCSPNDLSQTERSGL